MRPSFTPGADPASPQRLAMYPTTGRGDDGMSREGDEIVRIFCVVLLIRLSFVLLALSIVILGLDPRIQARPSETGRLGR
ncbi:hypothetical protein [Rhizobium binxianense]